MKNNLKLLGGIKCRCRKLLFVMKLTILAFFLGLMGLSASTYSQKTKLSLDLINVSIADVLKSIESQSEFVFIYEKEALNLDKKVSITVSESSVDKILTEVLEDTGASFVISEKQIVITKNSPEIELQTLKSRLENESQQPQKKEISGIVKDSKGQPLPGVSVVVKGTTIGTVTDNNGKFTISVPIYTTTLTFSFVGMKTKDASLIGKTSFNLSMEEETFGLEEVVAVGYGTQQKRDVTGAIGTINSDVIVSRPITRVDQALQGTVSGVSVESNSGQPGSGLSVRIRGINSITGSNDPLYVIDGYVGGNIEAIAPDDIETLDILKDASATAIYGSRGSNGVVLITTKRGKEGKMKVDFHGWASVNTMPRYMDLMNAYEFATVKNEISPNTFSDTQLASFKNNPGTDWQREVTRSPLVQNYQLTLSGGSPNIKYLISGNYLDQPGLLINQGYKRASFRTNLDIKACDKLDFKFYLVGFQGKNHNTSYSGDLYDPMALAATWDPTTPVRDANGNYNYHSAYGNDQINPVAQANNQAVDNITSNFSGTGMLVYKIIKGLTFTSTASLETQFQYQPTEFNKFTAQGFGNSDYAQVVNNRYWVFQNSNYFTYKVNLGDHAITLTALYEQQQRQNTSVSARSNSLSSYNNGYYNLGLGAAQVTTSSYWADQLQSFMGRVNYSYKDKYLLTASLRDDGSSHLTQKYSLFPSMALGWSVSKEDFLKDSKVISDLKLRASYGKTGNQAVGAYATIPGINVNVPYYFIGGSTVSTPLGTGVSPNLKWETTAQYDAGLDAAFLQKRLTFTFDMYKKKVEDLLYNVNAPAYNGGGTYAANVGSLENKGLEFTVGGMPISGHAVKWNTFLSLSINRNKILDLGGNDNILVNGIGQQQSGLSLLKVGDPIGMFYGYKFIGTWKTAEASQAALYGLKPGDAKYVDVNNDHVYDVNDEMPIGNALPKYTFGFTNDITYSNFTFSFMLQGMQGNKIYSTLFPSMYGNSGDARDATSTDALNMWTTANETNFPVINSSSNKLNSSRYVYDASFIKLKNISISFNVPERLIKKYMSSLQVYISGQNVFCLTPYKGYDPETTTAVATGASALGVSIQGLETGSIPNPRTYTFGVRASF